MLKASEDKSTKTIIIMVKGAAPVSTAGLAEAASKSGLPLQTITSTILSQNHDEI